MINQKMKMNDKIAILFFVLTLVISIIANILVTKNQKMIVDNQITALEEKNADLEENIKQIKSDNIILSKEKEKFKTMSEAKSDRIVSLLDKQELALIEEKEKKEAKQKAQEKPKSEVTIVPNEVQKVAETSKGKYLGSFEITAYCPCVQCCGNRAGITSTGTAATAGRTISVNPNQIPYGSTVYIEGYGTFVAEDCGGGIGSNEIDMFFNTHQEALNFGRQHCDVYIQ